ncbi:interleukin-17C-like [Amphiura filiformis]|uniref:interleukin-17C-like n=1 Tax=Amphiura filiformis TaxID=82378 RepID=UPI003B223B58
MASFQIFQISCVTLLLLVLMSRYSLANPRITRSAVCPHDGDIFDDSDLYPSPNGKFALYPFITKKEYFVESAKPPCPSGKPVGTELNDVASCPWDFTDDYDEDRIPAVIKKARCLCENCNGRFDMGCKEIKQPIKVFKKDICTKGYQMYRMETINVPVGCACAPY